MAKILIRDRHVSFGGLTGVAHSAPSGNEISGDFDGGYDFRRGNWTFGLIVGVPYMYLDVDDFSEDGSDPIDLNVTQTQSDSLHSRIGGRVNLCLPGWKSRRPAAPGRLLAARVPR